MKNITEVYNKLKKNYDDLSFNEYCNTIEMSEYDLKALDEKNKIKISLTFEDQLFEFELPDHDSLYSFLRKLENKTVIIERQDERTIRLNGFDIDNSVTRIKKVSVIRRVLNILAGIPLALFGIIITISGFFIVDMDSDDLLTDLCPFPLFIALSVIGISFIHHGCAKKPISAIRALFYGLGTMITSFGIALLMVGINDMKKMKSEDAAGVGVVIFLILFLGLFFIWSAFSKKLLSTKDTQSFIRRTPVFNSEEVRTSLIKLITEKTTTDLISIYSDNLRTPDIMDSKFFGVPYWDCSLQYPKCGDENMMLLAQINCSQLPENNVLPKEGMLQFFTDRNMESCQTVYHRHISENFLPGDPDSFYKDKKGVSDEAAMKFFKYSSSAFDSVNAPVGKRILSEAAAELNVKCDSSILLSELLCPEDNIADKEISDSHLLGYPQFCDEPLHEEIPEKYDTLLFQTFTDDYDFPCPVYIFINGDDLKDLDFSDTFIYVE